MSVSFTVCGPRHVSVSSRVQSNAAQSQLSLPVNGLRGRTVPLPRLSLLPSSSRLGLRHPPRLVRKEGYVTAPSCALEALVFDCDGVILDSEELHRTAYNEAFDHFNVVCPDSPAVVDWSAAFYDEFQNMVGGGKPKMRWYFNEHGWPSSTFLPQPPTTQEAKESFIDTLQVPTRPGVLRLMDEARAAGLQVAVCSASAKTSVVFVLGNLLGQDRFNQLDCFMAGDDVDKKKPDPTIYKVAAQRLGKDPSDCLVVEDSMIGLQAALGAGMKCCITPTDSTKSQGFQGASAVFEDLGEVDLAQLMALMA